METIDYLYDLVDQSDVSLLGYTHKNERIKDEFISKLPHMSIGMVDSSSFNFKQIVRDMKINQVLEEGEYFKWIVLDIGDVSQHAQHNNEFGSTKSDISFTKAIQRMVESIRHEMYRIHQEIQKNSLGLDFDDPESHDQSQDIIETPFKLLITTPLYKSSKEFDIMNFTGGSSAIYISDLAFVLKEVDVLDKIRGKKPFLSILKNRYGSGENLDVSLDGLENYKYICDYEYSK